jgi:hypothetical protein
MHTKPEGKKISPPPKKSDDGTESYSIIGVPKMFPTVAALGQVYSCSRGVL